MTTAEHAHDHPPVAHQSSRVDSRLLGIYFFIASEVMLFGSFFSAYFFARVVVGGDEGWPPPGFELPVYLAFLNTVILVTSSFTILGTAQSDQRQPLGADGRADAHVPARARSCSSRRASTRASALRRTTTPSGRPSTGSPGSTARTSSSG